MFSEGLHVDRVFLLLDGHIRVLRTTSQGDQIILLHIAPGQVFGIGSALGHKGYPAPEMAADDCVVLAWPNRLWPEFVARYAGFASQSYAVVGERLNDMHAVIVEMATKQVEQRLVAALLRLIPQMGRKVDDGIDLEFPITRQNISDMAGSALLTVSRLLSAWEKDRIVVSQRKKISATAPHRLVLRSGVAG